MGSLEIKQKYLIIVCLFSTNGINIVSINRTKAVDHQYHHIRWEFAVATCWIGLDISRTNGNDKFENSVKIFMIDTPCLINFHGLNFTLVHSVLILIRVSIISSYSTFTKFIYVLYICDIINYRQHLFVCFL